MDVPESLRVGPPKLFSRLVAGWGARLAEAPKVEGLDGQWVQLSGGPLPVPIVVRIDRSPDGRFIITGLLIGFRDRREITWETLRQIKPASILAWIFSGFDPKRPAQQYQETDPAPPQHIKGSDFDTEAWIRGDEDDEDIAVAVGSPEHRTHTRAAAAFQLWQAATFEDPDEPVETVTKPRASVAVDLAAFAEVYKRNLIAKPRAATTATAKELHISRATAIRRIAECKERGLLAHQGGQS